MIRITPDSIESTAKALALTPPPIVDEIRHVRERLLAEIRALDNIEQLRPRERNEHWNVNR